MSHAPDGPSGPADAVSPENCLLRLAGICKTFQIDSLSPQVEGCEYHVDVLLAGLSHEEMRAAVESSPGLCVPHFLLALERGRDDAPRRYLIETQEKRVGWVLRTHHPLGDTLEQVGAEHPPYALAGVLPLARLPVPCGRLRQRGRFLDQGRQDNGRLQGRVLSRATFFAVRRRGAVWKTRG